MVNVVKPGAGMHVDPATLDASAVAKYTSKASDSPPWTSSCTSSPIAWWARLPKAILQVLLFSVLFGFALSALGQRARPVVNLLEQLPRPVCGDRLHHEAGSDWRFWRDGLHHWQVWRKACPRWRP